MGISHTKKTDTMRRRFRLDQTLIIEAGLLSNGEDIHQLSNLLAAYEGAASENHRDLAAIAEVNLRKWVNQRRRKWSCGTECKPDCTNGNCQFRLGC